MSPRRLAVAALLLLGCGDDGGSGDADDGDATALDAAAVDQDAATDPDAAEPRSDAAPVPDGAPEADAGRAVDCSPQEATDGLTPDWLEGIVPAAPRVAIETRLLAVDRGPDCSVVVGGTTRGGVVLGQGQPGETGLDEAVWFVARYEVDGALTWVAELGAYAPVTATLSIVVMADGTTVASRRLGTAAWELIRIASDGVVQGEPVSLEAQIVRPWSGGTYVARTEGVTGPSRLERLSPDGEVEWSRSIGYPESVATLPDGRVLHAGGYDFGGITLNVGQPDAFAIDTNDDGCYVALYEPDGSLAWVRTIDIDGNLVPQCGAEAADGWVAAWVQYPNPFDSETFLLSPGDGGERIESGPWLSMVIRYDLDGTLAWYRGIVPGQEGELVNIERESLSVGPSAEGLVALGGRMSGTILFDTGGPMGGSTIVTSEPSQGWFARYTADGELLGPRTFSSPEPGSSVVTGSVTRPDGAAVLVGDFTETLALDPFALTGDPGGAFVAAVR